MIINIEQFVTIGKKLKVLLVLMLLLIPFAFAISVEDAKDEWKDAVKYHEQTKVDWREAQLLVAEENTPENTENPPCSVAIFLMSSWINTVLPTPAPPNNPVLPPFV